MTEVTENLSVTQPPRIRIGRLVERVALLVVWLLLIAAYGAAMPQSFLTWGNFSILFASYAPAAMLALAIIVPLTAGDYDLSVGATLTLSSAVIGVLNVWMQMPILLVLAIVIVVGVIVGLVNALFILFFRIPSLVVTLGTTSVMTGLVQWITNSSTIGGIDNALVMAVVGGRLFGVPYAFYYALAAAIIMWYVFDYTPVGRRLLFVGRGREVARLNGISVDRVRLGALIASGVLSALAGILYAGVLGSADPPRLRRRLPGSDHNSPRALQPLGRHRRGLFPRHRHHRPDHAGHPAVGDQRVQRRRADFGGDGIAAIARPRGDRHRLSKAAPARICNEQCQLTATNRLGADGVVMAGLVPAISLRWAPSPDDRDARVKPAHDAREGATLPRY
jgi:ribose transport system permease protein